jgi:hypothetical protein
MLGKFNLIIGKRASGKTTWIQNYLKDIQNNLAFYTITMLVHPTLTNSFDYKNIVKSNKEIKSPKIQIYDTQYFFDFAFENTFRINPNGHIIIIIDGFFSHDIDNEKLDKFHTMLKSNLPNITIIQEMQFLQKKYLLPNGYPYNLYFTKETSITMIESAYKTLENINWKENKNEIEKINKFYNFITNITEYNFVIYTSNYD